MNHKRSLDFARDERVIERRKARCRLDATLREEGSFSDFGDRKFGQVIPWKR
jgi:hypothetical protein